MEKRIGRGALAALLGMVVWTGAFAAGEEVLVYKSPTCGCCNAWVDHLRENGFKVVTRDTDNLPVLKARLGVTRDVASCHTAVVDGYVVEGHVPAEVIRRLLAERPQVTGVAAPGMPVGSPGMEVPGQPAEPYDVVTFDAQGRTALYERR